MKIRSNEVYSAVVAELEAVGATYRIEQRSKHPVLIYEAKGKTGQITIASSPGDWRAPLNAKRDIRQSLRERGLLPSGEISAFDPPTKTETTQAASLPETIEPASAEPREARVLDLTPQTLGEDNLVEVDGEMRMRDVDLGAALGYTRVLNVRALIESNRDELKTYGALAEEEQRLAQAGRPARAYLLNREQCLLVAVLSRTPRAVDVRRQVIGAYAAWERSHAPEAAASVAIPSEPSSEILANDQAIEEIVARMLASMPAGTAPAASTTPSGQVEGVSRKQFEEVMAQMVSWLRKKFDRNDRLLNEVYNARIDTGEGISNRVIQSHKDFLVEVKTALSDSTATITAAVQALQAIPRVEPLPQREAKPAIQPPPEADVDFQRDLVTVADIYGMVGLNPMKIPNRRGLGHVIGRSLTQYCRAHRIAPILIHLNTQIRNQWTRETVSRWYRDQGRDLILHHLNRHG